MHDSKNYEGKKNYCVQAMLSHYIPTEKNDEDDNDKGDGNEEEEENEDDNNDGKPKVIEADWMKDDGD